MSRILLVEDKESLAQMLREALESSGYSVEVCSSGNEAIRRVQNGTPYSLVLTDLRLPGRDGIEVLREVKKQEPECPVIVMTGFGTIENAVEAMKLGAFDFLQKPVDLDHLMLLVGRCQEHRQLVLENVLLKEELQKRYELPTIIGESAEIRQIAQQIQKVAATDSTVLLLGESGTGKELFARAIHKLSARRERPFIAVNCAAIPDTLLENELFGHEKGSYTGAAGRQLGKFELAHRGTIFLDEIGELGTSVQSKLLRAVQERTFERIGGNHTIEVDVRIVCATNRNLEEGVKAGSFREDLFYRIAVFPVTIPPLRARREDLPPLIQSFLERFRRELGKSRLELSEAAREQLLAYHWPGNIRELENCIERAAILCERGMIEPRDLRLSLSPDADGDRVRQLVDLSGTLADVTERTLAAVERVKLENVIRESATRSEAAEALGITPRTLAGKLKHYGISGEEKG
jgi:DNA-binding NtrC family response regulator